MPSARLVREAGAGTLPRLGDTVVVAGRVTLGWGVVDTAQLKAEDGMEALARVRQHQGRLDLLLTDVVMPGLSGSEIAAHLTKVRPALRVLYMSGYTSQGLSSLGVGAFEVELLEKTFSPRELLERVRGVLDHRAVAA